MPPFSGARELLTGRYSSPKLTEPGPDGEALERILAAAVRAPDHGMLRPWRFILIRGQARERLGEVFSRALMRKQPDVDEDTLARTRRKPLRAPLIIAVAAKPQQSPKAPEIEQVLSAGAAAYAMMLAAQSEGFAGMWRTGEMAYDPRVKEALGLRAADHVVGFLYLGTEAAEPPNVTRPDSAEFVTEWTGPT